MAIRARAAPRLGAPGRGMAGLAALVVHELNKAALCPRGDRCQAKPTLRHIAAPARGATSEGSGRRQAVSRENAENGGIRSNLRFQESCYLGIYFIRGILLNDMRRIGYYAMDRIGQPVSQSIIQPPKNNRA